MPYGAQKITLTETPSEQVTSFILTQDNVQVMQPNMPAPKKLTLKARLDLDGTGGKDKPGRGEDQQLQNVDRDHDGPQGDDQLVT